MSGHTTLAGAAISISATDSVTRAGCWRPASSGATRYGSAIRIGATIGRRAGRLAPMNPPIDDRIRMRGVPRMMQIDPSHPIAAAVAIDMMLAIQGPNTRYRIDGSSTRRTVRYPIVSGTMNRNPMVMTKNPCVHCVAAAHRAMIPYPAPNTRPHANGCARRSGDGALNATSRTTWRYTSQRRSRSAPRGIRDTARDARALPRCRTRRERRGIPSSWPTAACR